MFECIAALSGFISCVWISLGVYIAAKFYPNYNHSTQFCSELGATGSPTEKLSPLINNYPLGFIFCLFGWYLIQLNNANIAFTIVGFLIIIHGVGTWVAGYFPMDANPYTQSPTQHCKVHSWAGFIMILSLLIAPIIIAFSPGSIYVPWSFRLYSLITVFLSVYFLVKMTKHFKNKQFPGYYQRLSYWVKLIWLSVFSLILVQA